MYPLIPVWVVRFAWPRLSRVLNTRGARALRTALVSFAGRGLSIVGTLVTIPLVLNHLGPERYGLWMTLSVIFIYLKLADGGVTIGLVALVSRADGAGDLGRIRALFSSAFAVTVVVGAALVGVAVLMPLVDWRWLLHLSDSKLQVEAAAATAVIILSIAFGYPAGVARQGRLGLQQGAAANAWDLAGTVITFGGQIAVIHLKFDLVALAFVTAFTPVMVNAVSSAIFFAGKGRNLRPTFELASWPLARTLFVAGSVFMALTLVQALSLQIDTVLIARVLGVAHVAEYSVVQKLFSQPQLVITMLLTAQFPAYNEALTRGDHDWIVRHFKSTALFAATAAIMLCGLLAAIIEPLLKLWIGDGFKPPFRLVASMAVYGTVAAVANVFTYFFFALGLYRRVILAHIAMIVINIPLALFLLPRLGSAGGCIATTTGMVLALIVPSLVGIRAVLSDLPRLREKAVAGNISHRAD